MTAAERILFLHLPSKQDKWQNMISADRFSMHFAFYTIWTDPQASTFPEKNWHSIPLGL